MRKILFLLLILILSACRPAEVTSTVVPATATVMPTETAQPSPTTTDTTIPISPKPTDTPFTVCSPLEDETFESLPLILAKPLDIPPFGQDTGHHGQDFAYFQRGDRVSIEGIEIYALMAGKVVTVLPDNYPYGNAILIESPLSALPQELADQLMAAYLPVPDDPGYRLYCPTVTPPAVTDDYSIYHLYAHLQYPSTLASGEAVTCGETLGLVGNTGYSSSPHLHLEFRLGPSGATIDDMAHYENSTTEAQMATYCLWRMSGYYQLFDPFTLVEALP